MGVMSCSRKNCENIMCDTYVHGVGYVCNECQSEFKKYLIEQNKNPENEREIEDSLKIFIKTDKGSYEESPKISVDDFFKNHTK